jgi:hypothetical protein
MVKRRLAIIVFGLTVVLVLQERQAIWSQHEPCRATSRYENHNQFTPQPLRVRSIQGRTAVEVGGELQPGVKVSGACVELYRENDHELVSTAVTDQEGRFDFGAISGGRYRLVARKNPFCTANMPIRVVRSYRIGKSSKRELVIHFQAAGIDTCSYVTYEAKSASR